MGLGKKGACILAVLLLAQLVSATVTVDSIPASVYNIGDKVLVSGSVAQSANLRGYVGMGFVCGAKKVQTTSAYVDLKADEAQQFSQLLTVPQGLDGSCSVQVTLSDVDGNVVETKDAGSITITDVLDGNFQEVPVSFQLGDKLSVRGRVEKQDKSGIDGMATIYFKQNGESVFIESAQIANGEVNYIKDLSRVPAGSYTLDVAVADTFGNKNFFADLFRFSINNNIDFDVTVDKKQYGPGEPATISGLVKSTVQSKLFGVDVELVVDGKVQKQKLEDNTKPFLFKYVVARDAKAGDHVVRLSAKDSTGNFGEKEVVVSVLAQPTVVSLKIMQDSGVPEQNVIFEATLADQAGDVMHETVTAKLYNQKGEFEKSKLVPTQGQDFFIVPVGGLPGLWKIGLEGFGLSTEKSFVVKEHKALSITLDGENLIVKNTGNVRFDEYLAVKANEQESGKKLRLGLSDEAKLALGSLFDPGTYTLSVPFTGQKFENVVIVEQPGILSNFASSFGDVTGNVVANASLPERKTTLIVLFVVVLLSLALVLKPKGGGGAPQRVHVQSEHKSLRDYLVARKYAREARKAKSDGRAYRPEFGRADAQDVRDFRERMSKVWEEHQEKEKREQFQRPSYRPYRSEPVKKESSSESSSNAEGNIFDAFK